MNYDKMKIADLRNAAVAAMRSGNAEEVAAIKAETFKRAKAAGIDVTKVKPSEAVKKFYEDEVLNKKVN